jgi:hypothetical protein
VTVAASMRPLRTSCGSMPYIMIDGHTQVKAQRFVQQGQPPT